jgi:ABC-type multidrug transport system fused ATPase/permease subunit
MVEEFIPQVSAIFTIGLITSLIAYYVILCERVKRFMDKRKEEYTSAFSEYLAGKLEKLSSQTPPSNWIDVTKEFWKDAQLHTIELQEKILFDAYSIKNSLEAMRNAFFGSIIFFTLAIILCYSVYSFYAIYSFILALFLLLYGFSLFMRISRIF